MKELKPHKLPTGISYYDLNYFLSQVEKTVDDLTKEELNEIVFMLGLEKDTWEVEECIHRPKFTPNNSPWKGKRILGYERQDKDWILSKKSSLENIISSQTDMEHVADLVRMSQQANNTAYVSEQMQRFKPENPEVTI